MPIIVSSSGNICRLRLSGDFDFSSQDELKQAMDQAISAGMREVEIDLQDTNFIDSSIIRLFLKLRDMTVKKEQSLTIVNCSQRIREIFEIGGFDQIFQIR